MLKSILSVGGFTLLSRVTGLLRDIIMAAVIGAGPVMDAFTVAFRLPNHFRSIFAEGAFNAAFIPAFTKIRTRDGEAASNAFQGRVLAWLLLSQIILLALALAFTGPFVSLFVSDARLPLATELTRITFPYLLLITLVTLWGGILNATGRFSAAAAAPILLNLSIGGALLIAFLFPTPGHAAAWGVFVAGVLEAGFLAFVAGKAGLLATPGKLSRTPDIRNFFRNFVPAVIGSAGVQIAMLLDTIIAGQLPQGAVSAIYYADRLYQLPVGVIALAGGTVLLPIMSKLLAEGKEKAAFRSQNRIATVIFALSAPCCIAFLMIPDILLAGLFERGAFKAMATSASGSVLAAYSLGLPAIVLIRAVIPSFQARGDTKTPMLVSLTAVGINILLKLILTGPFGASGLAMATSVGAWINLGLLTFFAIKRGQMQPDRDFFWSVAAIALACIWLIAALELEPYLAPVALASPILPKEMRMIGISLAGIVTYFGFLLAGMRLLGLKLSPRG